MHIFNFLIAAGMDKDDATVIRDALTGGALNEDALDTIQMARRFTIDARDSNVIISIPGLIVVLP